MLSNLFLITYPTKSEPGKCTGLTAYTKKEEISKLTLLKQENLRTNKIQIRKGKVKYIPESKTTENKEII
jgi:hypothetical protein